MTPLARLAPPFSRVLPPRAVVVVSLAVAAAILGDSLMYAVLPVLWGPLGLEVWMVGVLLSANRFVRLASNPLAGWTMARAGVRGPFIAAVFGAAATTALYASGLGFAVLLLARALWGVCWSLLRLGGYLAALEAAGERFRGYYLGFFNGVTRFGSFTAVLLGGLLTDVLGFGPTVFLFVMLTLAAALVLLPERSLHPRTAEPPSQDASPIAGVGRPAESPQAGRRPAAAGLSAIHSSSTGAALGGSPPQAPNVARRRALYGLAFIDGALISGLVSSTLGLWLLQRFGPTVPVLAVTVGVATLTGWLLSVRYLSDFGWGPAAGHVSDRLGRRPVVLLAAITEALCLLGLAGSSGLLGAAAWAVVLFLAASALRAGLDASIGDLAPAGRRAGTLSWYATFIDLGAAVGPMAGYLLAGTLGLDGMYRSAALLLALAAAVYLWAFRADRRLLAPVSQG